MAAYEQASEVLQNQSAEAAVPIVVPPEEFRRSPLEIAAAVVSCYPTLDAQDGEYTVTVAPMIHPRTPEARAQLDARRPWDGSPVYGSFTTEGNPNGSLQPILRRQLELSGLGATTLTPHTRYSLTPEGDVCRSYSVGIQPLDRRRLRQLEAGDERYQARVMAIAAHIASIRALNNR